MRVVVTGSSGRIGRAIWVHLAAHGHDVVGLDAAPSSTAAVVADLNDERAVRRACHGAHAVVHTAALHAPHVGQRSDAEFQRANVDATRVLLAAAVDAGVQRLVFTSTTALYGAAAEGREAAAWIDEETVPQPLTVYHRSKLAAEALLEAAARSGGPSVRVLRMSRCFPEPAPAMAVLRLHRGVDARDVAQAHALALSHAGSGAQTFVISGPGPFVREDVARLADDAPQLLRERLPALAAVFAARGWSLPSSIDRVYDPGRALKTLGWRPRFGWESVLEALDQESSEVLPARAALQPISAE